MHGNRQIGKPKGRQHGYPQQRNRPLQLCPISLWKRCCCPPAATPQPYKQQPTAHCGRSQHPPSHHSLNQPTNNQGCAAKDNDSHTTQCDKHSRNNRPHMPLSHTMHPRTTHNYRYRTLHSNHATRASKIRPPPGKTHQPTCAASEPPLARCLPTPIRPARPRRVPPPRRCPTSPPLPARCRPPSLPPLPCAQLWGR